MSTDIWTTKLITVKDDISPAIKTKKMREALTQTFKKEYGSKFRSIRVKLIKSK